MLMRSFLAERERKMINLKVKKQCKNGCDRPVYIQKTQECRICYFRNYYKHYKTPMSQKKHNIKMLENFYLKKKQYQPILDYRKEGKSLDEIGKIYSVTRERIRQILKHYFVKEFKTSKKGQ